MASLCCRLCLLYGPELQPILNLTVGPNVANDPVTSALSQLIFCYLSIEPVIESRIETYICSECRNTITKWHWFRESCLRNDGIYRKMVQDPENIDSPRHIDQYHKVEVKQEPAIEIGEDEFSENLFTEPEGRPKEQVEAEVKQEKEVEIGQDQFGEDLLVEPLDPPPKEKRKRKGPSKKKAAKKSTPAEGETGGTPDKKKMGRPRISEDDSKPRPQMCTQCGKLVNNMSAHMIMHRQERRHQCPHCPKTFTSHGMMKYHDNVHTKEIKYTCPECDRIFWRRETLKMHMNSHKKEPAFKCPYCPKAYWMRTGLLYHEKTHTQAPHIPCDKCDRKFYSKSRLHQHAVMHMSVKPFVCKICERGFSKKNYLTTHLQKNHPNCAEPEEKPTIVAGEHEEILAD